MDVRREDKLVCPLCMVEHRPVVGSEPIALRAVVEAENDVAADAGNDEAVEEHTNARVVGEYSSSSSNESMPPLAYRRGDSSSSDSWRPVGAAGDEAVEVNNAGVGERAVAERRRDAEDIGRYSSRNRSELSSSDVLDSSSEGEEVAVGGSERVVPGGRWRRDDNMPYGIRRETDSSNNNMLFASTSSGFGTVVGGNERVEEEFAEVDDTHRAPSEAEPSVVRNVVGEDDTSEHYSQPSELINSENSISGEIGAQGNSMHETDISHSGGDNNPTPPPIQFTVTQRRSLEDAPSQRTHLAESQPPLSNPPIQFTVTQRRSLEDAPSQRTHLAESQPPLSNEDDSTGTDENLGANNRTNNSRDARSVGERSIVRYVDELDVRIYGNPNVNFVVNNAEASEEVEEIIDNDGSRRIGSNSSDFDSVHLNRRRNDGSGSVNDQSLQGSESDVNSDDCSEVTIDAALEGSNDVDHDSPYSSAGRTSLTPGLRPHIELPPLHQETAVHGDNSSSNSVPSLDARSTESNSTLPDLISHYSSSSHDSVPPLARRGDSSSDDSSRPRIRADIRHRLNPFGTTSVAPEVEDLLLRRSLEDRYSELFALMQNTGSGPQRRNNNNSDRDRIKHLRDYGAIKVFASATCPICLDDHNVVVALKCGHCLCEDDFRNLGGYLESEKEKLLSEVGTNTNIS